MSLPGAFLWFADPWQGRADNVSKKPLNRERKGCPRGGKNNYVFPAWLRRPTGCLIVDYARGKEEDGAAWSKVLLRLIERIQPEHTHAARVPGELVRIHQFDELIALIQEALKEKTNECPIERRGGQPSGCG